MTLIESSFQVEHPSFTKIASLVFLLFLPDLGKKWQAPVIVKLTHVTIFHQMQVPMMHVSNYANSANTFHFSPRNIFYTFHGQGVLDHIAHQSWKDTHVHTPNKLAMFGWYYDIAISTDQESFVHVHIYIYCSFIHTLRFAWPLGLCIHQTDLTCPNRNVGKALFLTFESSKNLR